MKLKVLGLALAVSSIWSFAAYGDDYTAYSNTAESVTGDISFDDFGITFAYGESLAFSDLVADHFVVDGKRVPASVYRVEEPGDPVLLNGNALCGAGDVTYVASWTAGDGLSAIAVFTGNRPPRRSDEMCASYIFQD
ncbi:hypothetical protein [Rhizobium sp. AC44/96]|uniref:hypothetical protein n=1 Tax=Rhizobium sp. AC44/96 TaxID=1841654 RepID=UPI000B010D87|nr:hypothetical protein [Rhizobium sp. AC44/96]